MRLTRLQVSNHKRVDDLEIEVRDHLVLVGANDVGKSSVLRVLDLILGASTAQIYGNISAEDFRDPSQPFVVEVDLSDFTIVDKALFPDEIAVDAVTGESKLTIRLIATVDDSETLLIERTAPAAGNSRQLSRDQQIGLGWKFLSATNQTRELREDRKSALDDILRDVDLGDEKAAFAALAETLTNALGDSEVLKSLRGSLANQLSKALPEMVAVDDLSFVPGSAADNDVLSDVRLQVKKDGVAHDLSAQSDGTRALYAIALYDLMSVGANVVGIDEPEVHLHPTSQRSLARLLRANPNQKIIATHSSDIVGAFDPDSIVVVHRGGKVVQPQAGFLSSDERMAVRWWVRDRLEPLTARRVIAVEGLSDRILLERAADLTARNLDRLGVSVLELGGFGDMGVIEKLFGSSGFNVPISRLIDEDAERGVANQLGLAIADLPNNSVWVSRGDLEEEYIRALGAAEVWGACQNNGQFSTAELRNGPTKSVTDATVGVLQKEP
jgi:putative ATP-dependent endonuclease of OLD family